MPSIIRSLFASGALRDLVRESYGLDVTACTLIRSFVNDVYEIATPGRRYVLKVYRHGGWSAEQVAWELELVEHLGRSGVPTARVVPLAGGRLLDLIEAPEGPRPYALTEFVEGRKPPQPFDDELYRAYGRLLGRLHNAGDSFRSTRPRRPFDIERTLTGPLEQVLPKLPNAETAAKLGELAVQRLTELAADGLSWGVRHGDVTMDNVHRTESGELVIHDFDLAGEGWLMADLAPCLSTQFAEAFQHGYTEERTLSAADLEALPWLKVCETVSNLRFQLVDKPAMLGTESLNDGWAKGYLAELDNLAAKLL